MSRAGSYCIYLFRQECLEAKLEGMLENWRQAVWLRPGKVTSGGAVTALFFGSFSDFLSFSSNYIYIQCSPNVRASWDMSDMKLKISCVG